MNGDGVQTNNTVRWVVTLTIRGYKLFHQSPLSDAYYQQQRGIEEHTTRFVDLIFVVATTL